MPAAASPVCVFAPVICMIRLRLVSLNLLDRPDALDCASR